MLNKIKSATRAQYLKLLQKDKRSFQQTISKILGVAKKLGR